MQDMQLIYVCRPLLTIIMGFKNVWNDFAMWNTIYDIWFDRNSFYRKNIMVLKPSIIKKNNKSVAKNWGRVLRVHLKFLLTFLWISAKQKYECDLWKWTTPKLHLSVAIIFCDNVQLKFDKEFKFKYLNRWHTTHGLAHATKLNKNNIEFIGVKTHITAILSRELH